MTNPIPEVLGGCFHYTDGMKINNSDIIKRLKSCFIADAGNALDS
jgi:hypothetical protein